MRRIDRRMLLAFLSVMYLWQIWVMHFWAMIIGPGAVLYAIALAILILLIAENIE